MLKFAALVPNCMFVYIGCLSECNSLGIYVRTFFLLTMSWEFSVVTLCFMSSRTVWPDWAIFWLQIIFKMQNDFLGLIEKRHF